MDISTNNQQQRSRSKAHRTSTEAKVDALLGELRSRVDAVATLERNGVLSAELARERTGISGLRERIARLVKKSAGRVDSATSGCKVSSQARPEMGA